MSPSSLNIQCTRAPVVAAVIHTVLWLGAHAVWKRWRRQCRQSGPLVTTVVVDGMPRLDEFCHATVDCSGLVHISGCIGLEGNELKVVAGGIEAETVAAMRCVKRILADVERRFGATPELLKVNVYLKDNSRERFASMNSGYAAFFAEEDLPYPARITVGCGALALGAVVEVDAVAKLPHH
eukprot:GFYU01004377.1.p1 GENE.GFYU01004377.1~~GFYU01004377.1.p1  ORF type:complete len:192 (-),score=26.55 GFYU01004377.1:390-932(-)